MTSVIAIGAADQPDHEASSDGVKKKARVTPAIREQVKQLFLADPLLTDREVLAEVKISAASLYRVLTDLRAKGEIPYRRGHGKSSTAGKKRQAPIVQSGTDDAVAVAAPAAVSASESGADVTPSTSQFTALGADTLVATEPVMTSAEVAAVPATAPAPASFIARVLGLMVGV